MTSPAVDPVFAAFAEAGLWPGLGKTLAAQLRDCGIRTPNDVLPSRLTALPQVGLVRAQRLVTAFQEAADRYEVCALLVDAQLAPRLTFRVIEHLGEAAADRLEADPWRLLDLPDVRLPEADRLARSILGAEAQPDDPRRGVALVAHALVAAARDGHTCMRSGDVTEAVQ
ncbi:MAG: helix-hairpin-helix domain-containing protein, partial [Mycobacteriales bacterium]